ESTAPPKARVPRPWETVVRIRIPDNHHRFVGFGSGTIIHSTEEESIILTCAHIFHIEGASKQPPPAQFPRKIIVEWFDGKLTGLKPAMVHPAGKTVGEAIDYDFAHDVGLIRIRPGRKLPASPVVPPGWKPQVGQDMIAVGCSEGNDATAWSTKVSGGKTVESQGRRCAKVECTLAPKQGRSGGGLYTVDGYVAGVCDFADYGGNRGLYATPASIHHLLNRNQLAFLYDPNAKGPRALLASNRGGRTPSSSGTLKLRSQNPPAERTEEPPITLPDPSLLGIKVPSASSARSYPGSKNSMAWEPPSEEMSPSRVASDSLPRNQARKPVADDVDDPAEALTAGLKMSPSATEDHISLDDDDFPEAPAPERTTDQPKAKGSSGWEAVRPRTPAVSASQER
ncbi:MAG: trypsin-like peptidase domain-containing protein, partial [Isosphaeraceae bacterium]|nr:trypsin-like peptidase domain-containing protein [Isosphaeraceae bacterium]